MKLLMAAPLAACLSVVAFGSVAAQRTSPSARRNSLAILGGFSRDSRFDATASPLPFAGISRDVSVKYDRSFGGDAMILSLSSSFHAGRFTPENTSSLAVEQLTGGEVVGSILREIAEPRGSRFAFGAAATASASLTRHQYSDPTSRISDFIIAVGTLGPAASWVAPLGGGALEMDLTSPLIALVDHPYSDSRSGSALTDIRLLGPDSFQRVSGAVTYTSPERRGVGLIYTYRYERLRYADLQPLHAMSHSLSVGIVTRFGKDSQ
jgi:hypothetical protein